jgi:hypothetical protein
MTWYLLLVLPQGTRGYLFLLTVAGRPVRRRVAEVVAVFLCCCVAPPRRGLSRLVLFITSRHGPRRKHRIPLLYSIVSVESCLFAKPLLSNGCLCWLHSSCLEQIYHNMILIELFYLFLNIQLGGFVPSSSLCVQN